MIEPKKCRHNPKILCGAFKNPNNCHYPTEAECQEDNVENWLGIVNVRFNSITLKLFRFNMKKIKSSVLEDNMCDECKVIWAEPKEVCPICSMPE